MLNTFSKLAAFIGKLLILAGGLFVIVGALQPWANAVLFESVHVSLPGIFFVLGSVAGACGTAALMLGRYPVLCLMLGIAVLIDTTMATNEIPHTVRGGLLNVQKSLFPLNELLMKFDLDTVMAGNYGAKDTDYIGEGVQRTALGAELILLGALLALPRDPWMRSAGRRFVKERCKACGARWPLGRDALYCPACATPTRRALGVCTNCTSPMQVRDQFCVKCGWAREAGLAVTKG